MKSTSRNQLAGTSKHGTRIFTDVDVRQKQKTNKQRVLFDLLFAVG